MAKCCISCLCKPPGYVMCRCWIMWLTDKICKFYFSLYVNLCVLFKLTYRRFGSAQKKALLIGQQQLEYKSEIFSQQGESRNQVFQDPNSLFTGLPEENFTLIPRREFYGKATSLFVYNLCSLFLMKRGGIHKITKIERWNDLESLSIGAAYPQVEDNFSLWYA